MPTMTLSDVVELLGGLEADGVPTWLDGGWCVDALVGRELRRHDDLDIAVARRDEGRLRDVLARHGFAEAADGDAPPWNYVLADGRGRRVDVHVFEFDHAGRLVYGVAYPPASLSGEAVLGGLAVRCIASEWMFRFKTAYDPAPKDIVDVAALAATFGFDVPPGHRA